MSKNGNTYFDRSVIEPDGETEGRTDMSQNPRQSKSIRAQLLTAMQVGEYAHCDRLPRESVLSEMLGISRTQLRDILASLDREGFITRRHGVGTIINRHVLGAPARMDIEVEFLDMIRQSGHTPGVAFVRAAPERRFFGSPGSAPPTAVLPSTARTWWKRQSSSGPIQRRSCASPFSISSRMSAEFRPIWT